MVAFPDMPIRLISDQKVPQTPDNADGPVLVGAPRVHEWKFVVAGEAKFGRAVWLKFLNLRPFAKGVETAGLWEVKVTVPAKPAE
ncbi:hypothetical protein IAD21_04560 [Abditibacteriota bacterium]|nr:hypothetical protein IAD21_04560 [Abditibacteriota bacterium]